MSSEIPVNSAVDPRTLPLVTPRQADQIQENMIAYIRLFAGLPGVTVVEEDCFWVASPGLPGNQVLRAQLGDPPTDAQITDLLGRIFEHTNQFDWMVFPGCRPHDLGERLAAIGRDGGPDGAWELIGKIGGPGGNWLITNLAALAVAPAVEGNFRVAQVTSRSDLVTWRLASADGFGHTMERMEGESMFDAYARHGFGAEATSLHYIGYVDDTPVTSGTLLMAGGIAGLYDISTPPALRRRGYGSAISWWMLYEAQQRGIAEAFVWSSNLGKGVYAGIGCMPVDVGVREYQWQKR